MTSTTPHTKRAAVREARNEHRRRPLTHEEITRHAQRGTAGMIRQSALVQVERYEGSRLMQADTIYGIAGEYGVLPSEVILFEGKGESAAGAKSRPEWDDLLGLIRANQLGLVIFTDHHRLARNTTDTDTLIKACHKYGVLIHVGKQLFDPRKYQERGYLRVLPAAMSVISEGQIDWFEESKYSLARRLSLRIKLPAGLVWASPDDMNYRTRMERAGLTHWLERLSERHRARSLYDGKPYYILPYPDAEVVRACELRLQWLLETQSLGEVYRRIRRGEAPWPRKGFVPNRAFVRFLPNAPMVWSRLDRRNMAAWFCNPLLYGVYATYRRHYASADAVRPRAHKGVHYTRSGHAHLSPLVDATQLLSLAPADPRLAPRAEV